MIKQATSRTEPDGEDGISFDPHQSTLNLLGMTLAEVTLEEEPSRKLRSKRGVAVIMLAPSSEASRGGLKIGDIIGEVNCSRVRTLRDMKKVLQIQDPRDPVFFFVFSNCTWRFSHLSFIG